MLDEELYQITRKIVGAELQNIVYSEFLPGVLGEQAMVKFNLQLPEDESGESVYDSSVDPNIRNEFATAVFTFGHSLIPNHILPELTPIRIQSNSCPVKNKFLKFEEFILGSGREKPGKISYKNNKARESKYGYIAEQSYLGFSFFVKPTVTFQVALDKILQRGRDHGLPSYTKCFCDLTALIDWENKPEDFSQPDSDNFQKVYSSVEDIVCRRSCRSGKWRWPCWPNVWLHHWQTV